ncbi:hypothetical protein GCM10020256_20450 [Streptomyces thermocoprophilus]
MTGPESEGSQVRRAVCPGSFDPITNGHLDIIARATRLYDEVYVAVMINKAKKGLFEIDERIELIRQVTSEYANVRVEAFHGLLVDFCKQRDIPAIVKGLRAVSDFDYELQMAQMNNGLTGVETLFVPTNPTYSFLSSSLVKEVAQWGGDVSHLVPPVVLGSPAEASSPSLTGPQPEGLQSSRPSPTHGREWRAHGGRAEEARRDRGHGLECPVHAHVGLVRGQPRRAARHAGGGPPGPARLPRPGPGADRRP